MCEMMERIKESINVSVMKAMGILFTAVLISSSPAHAQTDTVIDNRDGQSYSSVVIGNKIWLREHLRYRTNLSYCPTFNTKENECINGNYYSNRELDSICPRGWHVSTIGEWEEYVDILLSKRGISKDNLRITTLPPPKTIVAAGLKHISLLNENLLKLTPAGWIEGKKMMNTESLNLWVVDKRTNDNKYHLHVGESGYVIHSHMHNIIDKPKRIRMFNVRCVCEVENK
jgi:uncharacterized protein (TIGR02145 family)